MFFLVFVIAIISNKKTKKTSNKTGGNRPFFGTNFTTDLDNIPPKFAHNTELDLNSSALNY